MKPARLQLESLERRECMATLSPNVYVDDLTIDENIGTAYVTLRRVLAVAFEVLAEHHPAVAFDLIGQGLKKAAKRIVAPVLLVAAMLLCSTAEAAKPIKFRLYGSQLKTMVPNLVASQLHKQATTYAQMEIYLLDNEGLETMRERAKSCRAIGVPVVPGMRLGDSPTFKVADWVNPDFWAKKAVELAAVADMRVDGDLRVYIDVENYSTSAEATTAGLAQIGATREQLRAAMAPFLKVLDDKRVEPCFTPGNIYDHVQTLSADVCPTLEFLCESTFGNDVEIRGSLDSTLPHLVAWHQERREIYERLPQCKVTPGFYDETMRDLGLRARETYNPAHGEPDCWLFDRIRSDSAKIGTAEWLTGLSRSSRNDCLWFPLRDPAGWEEWQKRGKFGEWWRGVNSAHAGPRPKDCLNFGYWPCGERHLKDESLTLCKTSKPFTLAADVYLVADKPTAFASVWYVQQGGGDSWNIRQTAGRWHLDYADKAGKTFRSACSVASRLGTQRLVLVWDGAKYTLSADAEVAEVAATPQSSPVIWLRLGYGVNDKGVELFGDDLRIQNVMIWQRALTAGELPAVRTNLVYPFEK